MIKDLRVWVDVALLFFFPATVFTGLFHGPGWFPCYYHAGMAFFLVVAVIAHLVVNEHGLRLSLKRFREIIFGLDEISFEDVFSDPDNYDEEE
mgnify:FL=1